ncbi:hypothetical protein BDQ12DRAFT_673141 [Crucibulum laeve]|uniref:BZIP domain-containing protein n=1 Tax=Crucibulum laeve TaxID=68775 RepID=A0A5C3MGP1_9AGAR|nr:hypothetical protein BDQ12DRAFT_673141 [Crucibulum laeve]
MTRGRKKDLSIPPTRALVQQRDYRARKAHYVTELEERCRQAEEDNVRLRQELADARAGLAVPAVLFSPQTAEASSELMRNLALASSSLARFQQLAFSEPHFAASRPLSQSATTAVTNLRPASFPSPAPSPPYSNPIAPSEPSHPYYGGRKRLYREDSPPPPHLSTRSDYSYHRHTSSSSRHTRSPSLGSECCGGIMDCRDLVEREGSEESDEDSTSRTRFSGLRSTSEGYSSTTLRPCT